MQAPQQQDMATALLRAPNQGSGSISPWTLGYDLGYGAAAAAQPGNFEITGDEFSQVLEVKVGPGEVVTAEPGTMLYMSSGMSMGADIGGLAQGCTRSCCAGESLFRLHLENRNGAAVEKVGLTPMFPARIVPVDLQQHDGLVFNSGAFLGALGKRWSVGIKRVQGLGTCCFGGQGLFLNTLHGDGMVFLNAGGTVMTKHLQPGEEIVVDHHSLLAFERTVNLSIRRSGGVMVCCCAGQGLFNAVLTGPGFVMVHTMGLSKLRRAVQPAKSSNDSSGCTSS